MLAYHNDQKIKDDILAQISLHASADEIVKGQYWENGKGCAVGCTIHSGNHAEYEPRFGIPQMLAHLEDRIFEGLPNGKAKIWPARFMGAIHPGADLSHVGWKFQHWLLTDAQVNQGINHPLVKDAVEECATLIFRLATGEPVEESAARNAAASAARAAENAARNAAWSAAWSAESAENAARNAAWSAAWSAESAASAARAAENAAASAESAASAARNTAWNAAASAESAASAARNTARNAAYVLMADKLIELIEAAPLAEAA